MSSPTRRVCMPEIPIGWPADMVRCSHPLDLLAGASGGDVGAGPGTAIGAALGLKHMKSDRLPIAVMGDGDYLMGVGALWVAAANQIPFLIIVSNNRAYGNDVQAQERTREAARPAGREQMDWPGDQRSAARSLGSRARLRCRRRRADCGYRRVAPSAGESHRAAQSRRRLCPRCGRERRVGQGDASHAPSADLR